LIESISGVGVSMEIKAYVFTTKPDKVRAMPARSPRKTRTPIHPWSAWWDVAIRSADMMIASGEVIARRSQWIGSMGATPSASDQRELQRMVGEKLDASQDSLLAISIMTGDAYWSAAMRWIEQPGWTMHGALDGAAMVRAASGAWGDAARIVDAGMKPFGDRAKSNARRLRKRKP
jgi:hypothetical protein